MPDNIISKILKHRTAANLFLMLMIILGLYSGKVLNTQFFPNYSIDYISINMEWPGASPEDIEESIIKPIENKVRYIDNIKNTKSTAKENSGKVLLEFEVNTDMKRALSDVERGIKSILSFPENAKKPDISQIVPYEQIGLVLIKGNATEYQLKRITKDLRQDLLDNGIDKIEIDGIRQQVIYVDLDPLSLFANHLDVEDVANIVRQESKNIPSGILMDNNALQLRTKGKRDNSFAIDEIKIKNSMYNTDVKIKDIATVYESINEKESNGISKNQTAFTLRVYRSLGNDTLEITRILEKGVSEFKNNLSENIQINIYDLSSQLIRDRINLLLKNGLGGLILVLFILYLFLRLRVVIWVAVGIPAAISVTLAIMLISGQSINMISLFALIMMLGIIVDDSIVVAEHIQYNYDISKDALNASYTGAINMLGPVTAASLTTIAGFAPVFLISGVIGQVIQAIPLVAVSVIIASFFECFLVLPGHLKEALLKERIRETKKKLDLNPYLNNFKNTGFLTFLKNAIKFKYTTFVLVNLLLLFSICLIKFGHVKFYFFPSPESQIILVNYNFNPGNLRKDTIAFSNHLEKTLKKIDADNIVQTTYATIGKPIWGSRISTNEVGDNIGGMIVEINSPEERSIRTNEFIKLWKKNILPTPNLQNLTIIERKGGPPGLDIDIRLRSKTKELSDLKEASEFIKSELRTYKGITDIRDNLPKGKREINFILNEKGKSLGFNTKYVASKIKYAFDGIILNKFFRGEDEIEILIRNDPNKYDLSSIKSYLIKSSSGKFIPLIEIVDIKETQGFSVIKRRNGYREISVTAEINEAFLNPDDLLKNLKSKSLRELTDKFNIEWKLAGRAEEQADTFSDMKRGALLSLGVIYLILAFIFQSYFLPFSIMVIIPFTLIGVIIGHWVTGFDITILSLVAVLGLTGIVINDSIIMVANIYRKVKQGLALETAVIIGSQERLRAVILTSLTTIGGLTPLLFETSIQAQFLKPMAITIVFGLISSTILVLVVIPIILIIGYRFKNSFRRPKIRN